MRVHQSFEELAKRAAPALRRAFSGGLAPEVAARAVDAALTEGEGHSRRLRRTQNPVGYLYRIGCAASPDSNRSWLDHEHNNADSGLLTALAGLPEQQPCAVWLVKACGWTNVQAGEALDLTPELVATHVAAGVNTLQAELAISETNLSSQLHVLAEARAAEVPEKATRPAEPAPTPTEAQTGRRRLSRPNTLALRVATAVVCIAVGVTLVVRAVDSDDIGALTDVDVAFGMHDRDLVTRPEWTTPMTERGLTGVLAVARVGDTSPVRVANAARADAPVVPAFWLAGDSRSSAIDQLDLLEQLALAQDSTDSLALEQGPGWRLIYDAGTDLGSDPAIGWLVGIVESGGEKWVFAFNVDLQTADGQAVTLSDDDRLRTVIDILGEEGII